MRAFLIILSCATCVGCGALERPSSVRPPSHPLLLASSWLHDTDTRVHTARPTQARPPLVDQQRRRLGQNLDRIDRRRYTKASETLYLVRASYAGTRPRRALGKIDSIPGLLREGAPVGRDVQTGDVLFFKNLPTVPPLAIVRRVHRDGRIEAVGSWRGRLRTVRVHLGKPSSRRHKNRIVNSFIRQKRPGDDLRFGYLAGELVVDTRRYLGHMDH